MDFDIELYKGKKFSSLLKDIVVNSQDRSSTIEKLIDDLRAMVKTPNDAVTIIPMIREYLDVTVKNDEQLVKLAAIVQRAATSTSSDDAGDGMGLSSEERKQLMADATTLAKESAAPVEELVINKP